MGDSLTDKRHWANREKLWSEVLVKKLKDTYGSEVTLVNPAIGGTTLSQNVVLIPRWLQGTPAPDLVTIWFGGNDWNSGVRGPRYRDYLKTAVEHLRQATRGQTEILLMTTCPGFNAWQTMNELCRATYGVARDCKTGFADVAGAFQAAGAGGGSQTAVLGMGQCSPRLRGTRPDRCQGRRGHRLRRVGRFQDGAGYSVDENGRRFGIG